MINLYALTLMLHNVDLTKAVLRADAAAVIHDVIVFSVIDARDRRVHVYDALM